MFSLKIVYGVCCILLYRIYRQSVPFEDRALQILVDFDFDPFRFLCSYFFNTFSTHLIITLGLFRLTLTRNADTILHVTSSPHFPKAYISLYYQRGTLG